MGMLNAQSMQYSRTVCVWVLFSFPITCIMCLCKFFPCTIQVLFIVWSLENLSQTQLWLFILANLFVQNYATLLLSLFCCGDFSGISRQIIFAFLSFPLGGRGGLLTKKYIKPDHTCFFFPSFLVGRQKKCCTK